MPEFQPERAHHIPIIKSPERMAPLDIHRDILAPSVTPEKHTLEAAKVKKLQKKPVPPLWKSQAEFLPQTAAFLKNCGIDPAFVDPKPMGWGFTHIVFSYLPDGQSPKVIKIPRASTNNYMTQGYHEDLDNIALVKKYFGEYSVPTELRLDPSTGKYVYIQDAIKGNPINHLTETQYARTQLVDMARLNREMMRQTGQSLDFLGIPGFFSLLRHHIRHIFSKNSSFEVSNVLIDDTGKLKIIDDGLLRFRNVPFKQRMISSLGFMVNRVIMRLYFGVDLKPKQ